jgi:hypothetical protein
MQITPEQILVGIGLLLAAWYLLALVYNRRRGHAAYRWLISGLDMLGEDRESKWLGSAASGAQIVVNRAAPPYRRVEVIYLLESRELLPLWLVDLLRNKRDQLIFKAILRIKHPAEVEIAPLGSRTARRIERRLDQTWTTEQTSQFFVARRGKDAVLILDALQPFLSVYGDQVRSISWSKGRPELIIILALGPLLAAGKESAELFTSLMDGVGRANREQDA